MLIGILLNICLKVRRGRVFLFVLVFILSFIFFVICGDVFLICRIVNVFLVFLISSILRFIIFIVSKINWLFGWIKVLLLELIFSLWLRIWRLIDLRFCVFWYLLGVFFVVIRWRGCEEFIILFVCFFLVFLYICVKWFSIL